MIISHRRLIPLPRPSSTKLKPLLVEPHSHCSHAYGWPIASLTLCPTRSAIRPTSPCASTNVSVADLQMLTMGVPPNRGHGGSAGSATKTPGGKHPAHRSSASLPSLMVVRGSSQRLDLDREPSGGSLAHSRGRSQSRLCARAAAALGPPPLLRRS